MDNKTLDQIGRAKKRGVPFLAISTSDPTEVAKEITEHLNSLSIKPQGATNPVPTTAFHWDIVRGIYAAPIPKEHESNDTYPDHLGAAWIDKFINPPPVEDEGEDSDNQFAALENEGEDPPLGEGNPCQALETFQNIPPQSICFFHQADRWLTEAADGRVPSQAAANLRDAFKSNFRMIVFLAPQIELPHELRDDTLVLDDPLPTPPELEKFFDTHKALGTLVKDKKVRKRAAAFVTGLSRFGAEQALYLALNKQAKEGIDLAELRELRHGMLEQTPGLSICRGDFTFDDVGGVPYAKKRAMRAVSGQNPPNSICVMDELEKMMGGTKGDNTGVSQDQLGFMLNDMERNGDQGIILLGPPGCTKSFLGETLGQTIGVDTIRFDLNAMKQGEVGSSERNIRQAMKTTLAASGGQRFWVATCNAVCDLDAALLRRFTKGILFFDLPTAEERKQIWKLMLKRYNLAHKGKIDWDAGWSGAEIRNCCYAAWDEGLSVQEAAEDISPISVEKPMMIHELRAEAHNKYRSATTGKYYQCKSILEAEKRKKKNGTAGRAVAE